MQLAIFRLWTAVLCGYLALGATLQILPIYLDQKFQTGPFLTGTIISIASLAAGLTRPIAGKTADKGFALYTAIVGSFLGILGGIGHGIANSLPLLFLSRLFLGAGEGALFIGAISLIIYHCPSEKRGTLAGWFGLSMWGGLCAGPILAVWIKNIFNNTLAIWILVSALPIIGFILLLTITLHHKTTPNHKNNLVLLPQGARLPGFAFLLTSYGYGSINAMLILYLEKNHLGGTNIVLSIFAIFFLFTRIIGSPLVNRFDSRFVLLNFIVIEIIGLMLITSSWLHMILLGTAITGIGAAMLYPGFVALVVQRVPFTQQGAAVGFMTSFWDFGLVIAGPIGGMIATFTGFNMVFLIAGIFSAIAFLLILKLNHQASF